MPMQPTRALARLAENPVFATLDKPHLLHLLQHSHLHTFQRGETVFDAGQRCEGLHAVLDGCVKVYARAEDGHEKVIDVVSRGHTLPGTHPVRTGAHVHHARALGDTAVLVVPHEVLRNELHLNSEMASRLLDDAVRQVHRMMREIETTSLCSAAQRVCDYLLHLPALAEQTDDFSDERLDAPRGAPGERVVVLPVSKGVVASLLSITPEHFSRVLRDLQTEGLIDMQQRTIRLLAPDRLARRR